MLRCLLPGDSEPVAGAEERLQAEFDVRRRIGKRCVVCCCERKGPEPLAGCVPGTNSRLP
ncbi:MAG TPA: hypothetical protein DFS52_32345 [Myxococcales bacterium]|nr:hypothetical protein [Myxococcales bacterium]